MKNKPIFIASKPSNEDGNGLYILSQSGSITKFIKSGSVVIPLKGGKK